MREQRTRGSVPVEQARQGKLTLSEVGTKAGSDLDGGERGEQGVVTAAKDRNRKADGRRNTTERNSSGDRGSVEGKLVWHRRYQYCLLANVGRGWARQRVQRTGP